jgi:predicted ATPase
MLIAISGSQGCGKSSLLNELQQRGYNVLYHKTAREVLSEWNMTPEQVYMNSDSIQEFQTQLLTRKISQESQYVRSDQLFFTERTYMDLFAYAVSHLGNKNRFSSWIDDYYSQCKVAQDTYQKIFYINGGMFQIQNDGVRPYNQHYSIMVDSFMKRYTNASSMLGTVKTIDFDGIYTRADFIQKEI